MLTEEIQKKAEASRLDDIEGRLAEARKKTWKAVEEIARAVVPGMSESEAIKEAQKILAAMGSRKFWHKCHVRFGSSTVLSFDDPYVDSVLGAEDIFFVDIGPVWDGIEGDAGTSFVLGDDAERKRCRDDVVTIFEAVKRHWQKHGVHGKALYEYADKLAQERGWELAPSYVRGHRLSEFPHSFHSKAMLGELEFCPTPQRWVLEIHICDPQRRFGAFHEDIL